MKCKRDGCGNQLGLKSYSGYCSENCQRVAWHDWLELPELFRKNEGAQLELFPEYADKEERTISRRLKRLLHW